jgi:hypothetical protein
LARRNGSARSGANGGHAIELPAAQILFGRRRWLNGAREPSGRSMRSE